MYKLYKEAERTYYKYQSWTQPTLTSNGTMGTSNFACYAYSSADATHQDAYLAFSPNTGYVGTYDALAVSTLYILFESKNPLLISKLSFYVPINGTQNDYNGGWAENLYLYGANEKGAWEQIGYIAGGADMGDKTHTMDLSSNTKPYKLFKFQGSTKGTGHNDELDISQIQITAKQGVVSTSNNYDFYVEKDVYKAVKEIPKMNVEVVGNPTIKDGIISGFSSGNYALVPGVPSNITSYEMVARFTTASLNSVQMGILANSNTNRATPQIVISAGNNLCFDHPKDANTWVSSGAVLALTANTTYWAKMAWDGSTVSCYYKSPTDTDWVLAYSSACTTVSWIEQLGIGIDGTSLPFNGSIDLKECYVKINGQMWWSNPKELVICKAYKGE